ncbi:short-chain dehydrogenases/reductases (SDR) family protein [Pleurotus pulmonarius]
MPPKSQPKTAIVTGAAQGIGRAIAIQLARDGFDVVISDLASKQDLMNAVAEEILLINTEGQTLVVPADVSSETDVNNLVAKTKDVFGGLDVMVANAGICSSSPILDVTVEEWDNIFSINVRGVLLCYQAAARLMIQQKRGGRIIGASSIAGKKGGGNLSAYSASKFAVRSLTQSAACEWGAHGITVNAYAPGTIETPMLHDAEATMITPSGASHIGQLKASTALGRTGQPEEIANFVAMLASEKSGYMTGQTITIDGGIWFD